MRMPQNMGALLTCRIMLCGFSIGFADIALAEIYKGQDLNGNVWYSDRSPKGVTESIEVGATLPPLNVVVRPRSGDLNVKPHRKSRDTVKSTPAAKRRQTAKRKHTAKKSHRHAIAGTHCKRYETALRKIQARLRAGYKVPQGNKLRARRRELKEYLYAECR